MRTAIVTYTNDYVVPTAINGTEESIKEYFSPGRWFNLGLGPADNMQQIVSCEVLPGITRDCEKNSLKIPFNGK